MRVTNLVFRTAIGPFLCIRGRKRVMDVVYLCHASGKHPQGSRYTPSRIEILSGHLRENRTILHEPADVEQYQLTCHGNLKQCVPSLSCATSIELVGSRKNSLGEKKGIRIEAQQNLKDDLGVFRFSNMGVDLDCTIWGFPGNRDCPRIRCQAITARPSGGMHLQ